MTKEELFNRWIFDTGQDYIYTGFYKDREQFFEDLEAWYISRHVKELNVIKAEIIKSVEEISEFAMNACTRLETNGDCLASTPCPYCTDPPQRFLKGYDCYD